MTSPREGETWYVSARRPVALATGGDDVRLPPGTSVEVLSVDGPEKDGVRGYRIRAQANGKEGVLFSGDVSPIGGSVWRPSVERDVPWTVLAGAPAVLSVGELTTPLVFPDEGGGALEVEVGRWGDTEPLFRVRVCDELDDRGASCPWADVTVLDGRLTQLNVPHAWRLDPVLLPDEPDCAAAASIEVVPEPRSVVLELAVPAFRDEPGGTAVCTRVGTIEQPAGTVVICTAGGRTAAYILRPDDVWERVVCGSDPFFELNVPLQYRGVTVRENGRLRL